MKVVFMGSPGFAVPSLRALVESARHTVVAVVSQPTKPKGRGRRPSPSAVSAAATELGLPVLEPARLTDASFLGALDAYAADVLAVVAYGKLLPPAVLRATAHGAVNVHPSLLPRYRGAAPIQHAVLNGDTETGVTTMLLDEGWDSGGMLMVETTPIRPEEDAGTLADRLSAIGARLLVATLDGLETGDVAPRAQDPCGVTHAPKLSADDAWIDWKAPAEAIARKVRGLTPWPIAQTTLADGRRFKILSARAIAGAPGTPGEVVEASGGRVAVACGDGRLEIDRAQAEGKRAVEARDLVNGRVVSVGDALGVR